MAGLAAAVLLVDELRPHLGQLGAFVGPDLGAAHGFGALDFSGLDSIDESLSDMDAGFEAAADSGGGDGGDGGGGGD